MLEKTVMMSGSCLIAGVDGINGNAAELGILCHLLLGGFCDL